jgi:Sec-independent protein translocase protein TatA
MIISFLRRPTPMWFSLIRLVVVVAVLLWMGYDGNFKPVGVEVAATIHDVSSNFDRVSAELDAQAEAQAKQRTSTSITQQPSQDGAAK